MELSEVSGVQRQPFADDDRRTGQALAKSPRANNGCSALRTGIRGHLQRGVSGKSRILVARGTFFPYRRESHRKSCQVTTYGIFFKRVPGRRFVTNLIELILAVDPKHSHVATVEGTPPKVQATDAFSIWRADGKPSRENRTTPNQTSMTPAVRQKW